MLLLSNPKYIDRNNREITFSTFSNSQRHFNKPGFQKINFGKVRNDTLNCFDPSTDKFTAPYSGVYCFCAGARITGISQGYAGLGLFVNNSLYTMIDYKASVKCLLLLQGSASIYLYKGSVIDLRSTSTADAKYYLHDNTTGAFIWYSGYLVFKDQ